VTGWVQTNAGGVNGVTVAAGSGGSADGSTPYDVASVGASAVVAYDTTHPLYPGGLSVKFSTGASAVTATASHSTSITWATPMWCSACFYFTAIPTAQTRILTLLAANVAICAVNITTSGFIQCSIPANAIVSTGAIAITANKMFRVELKLIALSATVGQAEARWFSDAFSNGTPTETKTTTATGNTGTTTPDRAALGIGTGVANIPAFWGTHLQEDNTAYPAPPYQRSKSGLWVAQRPGLFRPANF
jgi:hypothetical protein